MSDACVSQDVGMCRIDFLFLFGFGSVCEVRNEFDSVRFENMRFSSDIVV